MIGVLITARMGSSRLEAKHLIQACGRPLIGWLCARLEREFALLLKEGRAKIIIATSEKPENKAFLDVAQGLQVEVFFGSDNKIPLRHLQCAEHYSFSHIISVDGDDILCSPRGARMLFEAMLESSDTDLFEVCGLPLGMNPGGYRTAYLRKCIELSSDERLETGWGRIFTNPRRKQIKLGDYDPHGELRFTLDYPEDAQFFQRIIDELKDAALGIGDEALIALVRKMEFYKLNAHLQDTYWARFHEEKTKESGH